MVFYLKLSFCNFIYSLMFLILMLKIYRFIGLNIYVKQDFVIEFQCIGQMMNLFSKDK